MMKYMFMIIFMIPFCFLKKMFWLVQMMMFFLMFLFMMISLKINLIGSLSYFFGCDMISYGLIMLSIWICVLMLMSSSTLYKNNYYYNLFLFNVVILLLILMLTFSALNLFLFYLFFESSLIPTLILIMGWGYQSERIQASMYLLFYTLFASLPLLLGIFYFFYISNTMMIYFMKFYNFDYFLLYFVMIFAFLVKMPMFFVHLWLPKAHVEAPVSGSMILAGIMLKLGGYGLLRLMVFIELLCLKYSFFLICISLIGGFYVCLMCFCQTDIKSLIAYSSVAHMSMVLCGIMTMNIWGFVGAYILMIGHGLCSSGLFCLVNINYERLHSRSFFINKGMINIMPSLSLWWFLMVSSNMAAPPSLNLMGEISLINSVIGWSFMTMIFIALISFFSAGYGYYLYSFIQHGKYFNGLYSFHSGVCREYLLLFLHWFPLNILFMKIDYSMIWF